LKKGYNINLTSRIEEIEDTAYNIFCIPPIIREASIDAAESEESLITKSEVVNNQILIPISNISVSVNDQSTNEELSENFNSDFSINDKFILTLNYCERIVNPKQYFQKLE
jgi:hypothetical protein